ncbi:MAG TPA: hypothetical protein VFP72_04245 [Kineosporiaceae bacterium]|nr:hypothetical protein [Kineosporiaceae bacterium]
MAPSLSDTELIVSGLIVAVLAAAAMVAGVLAVRLVVAASAGEARLGDPGASATPRGLFGVTPRPGMAGGCEPPSRPGRVSGRLRGRRLPRRVVQLYAGLVLYGLSMAFMVRARLGVMPWDVLHQGLAGLVHWSMGAVAIAVGVLVLLLWVPLRQRPGIGTVSNVVLIGLALDVAMRLLPQVSGYPLRLAFLLAGLLLNAVATAAYIGAGLGPGPRDGLMTGLVRRRGWPVRRVRTAIEVSVVAGGWLLGGNFGPGTLLYALAIGPLVHPLLPRFAVAVAADGHISGRAGVNRAGPPRPAVAGSCSVPR